MMAIVIKLALYLLQMKFFSAMMGSLHLFVSITKDCRMFKIDGIDNAGII
jgi:hypothetical protein